MCDPPLPDSDSLGEPTAPHKGLDCYLDSLFDPVLSYGDAVRMAGAFADRRYNTYTPGPSGGVTTGCLLGTGQRMREGILAARDATSCL